MNSDNNSPSVSGSSFDEIPGEDSSSTPMPTPSGLANLHNERLSATGAAAPVVDAPRADGTSPKTSLPALPSSSLHSVPKKLRCVSTCTTATAVSFGSDDDDDDRSATSDMFSSSLSGDDTTSSKVSSLFRSITTRDALDILFAVAVFAACEMLPGVLFRDFHWRRPIPYQVLNDGQVILDQELMYPHKPNTVSQTALVVISIVAPVLVFVSVCLGSVLAVCFRANDSAERLRKIVVAAKDDFKSCICMLLVGHGVSFVITHCLKVFVGRFRPNFYAFCQFSTETLRCESPSESAIITAQHSFPSGHSSESFTGMTLVSFYLLGKVVRLKQQRRLSSQSFRCWILVALSPYLVAIAVAASRLHDFMHHPSDVLTGSWIGIGCGILAYHMWYPCPVLHAVAAVSSADTTTGAFKSDDGHVVSVCDEVGLPFTYRPASSSSSSDDRASVDYNLLSRRRESEIC